MKKIILVLVAAVYSLSLVGCAEYKVSDIKKNILTMNDNGQKEIQAEKAQKSE